MTSSCYRSVRRVVGPTLLLFGLSLSVSSELLAQAAFTQEAQRLEESATAATAATEDVAIAPPPPASGGSGWEFDSDTLLDFTATTLGATGGVVGGFYIWAVECGFGSGPICGDGFLFTVMALGGVSGGYLAYKNRPLALVFGGLFLGSSIGLVWDGFQSDQALPPKFLLSTALGGSLGYLIWKARDARGPRVALSPYRDSERSGVMLSGWF